MTDFCTLLRSSPTAVRRRWLGGPGHLRDTKSVEILADGGPPALATIGAFCPTTVAWLRSSPTTDRRRWARALATVLVPVPVEIVADG
ncbi:hypothetical protein, partial [Actinoplanes sp. NPDC051851]|uniref:hypothetical protein n=1 Tax=Actinoplanes sp. NPDC051851 TaxID=3154753 RepID=UPI0034413243